MPRWIQDQALPTKDKCPFTGWGSSFQAEREVTLPFWLTQFAPNRKIEHPVFLSESGSDSPTSPDMILGRNLIRKLGLDLKFNDNTPAIIWEDVKVPMVPRGHWTPARIDEACCPPVSSEADCWLVSYDASSSRQNLNHQDHRTTFPLANPVLQRKTICPIMTDLSTLQTTMQELWTLTNKNSTRYRTVEWSPCRLDWPVDNSATPFQKSQALYETKYEATASSPRVNYDRFEY
jgi:hypothetical protein